MEIIYKNYKEVFDTIRDEEKNYKDAIVREPEKVEEVYKIIKEPITASEKKKYKNRDPDEIFEKLMTGEEELLHNDQFIVNAILNFRKIMDRGIRTPEQIIEDIANNVK